MKFSGGMVVLILVALALIVAMVITLWLGGSRSRHGYGAMTQEVDSLVASGQAYLSVDTRSASSPSACG